MECSLEKSGGVFGMQTAGNAPDCSGCWSAGWHGGKLFEGSQCCSGEEPMGGGSLYCGVRNMQLAVRSAEGSKFYRAFCNPFLGDSDRSKFEVMQQPVPTPSVGLSNFRR
mmetsp:Transcript_3254/g.4477  ORF Transcript_3254/g.4477 Transcript_3254/m.4477 type:complete len:110 (+) Transcript_3254:145-474(+)